METAGSGVFRKSISQAKNGVEADLMKDIADWADGLPSELCRVSSMQQDNPALYLRRPATGEILVRGFNWQGVAQITLWRGPLESRAPKALSRIQRLRGWRSPHKNDFKGFSLSPALFKVLTEALEESVGKR